MLAIRGLERTTPEFRAAFVAMGDSIGVDANFIAAVMANESGFNPAAVNPMSGASGLIQWMPSTARAMGTTVEAIRGMSAEEQLPLVGRYFAPFASRIASAGDAYMVVFMPAHVGKPPGTIIATSPDKTYTQNQVFDIDRKGFLTVGDVERKAQDVYDEAIGKPPLEDGGGGGPGAGGVFAVLAIALAIGVAVGVWGDA